MPDRVDDGYGLTIIHRPPREERGADVLITVDNGIASVEGVAGPRPWAWRCSSPTTTCPAPLPAADAIVNPNQPGCTFEQIHGQGGRDVLRAAGPARRAAPARCV